MMKPGGTGIPSAAIRASPAPLPPNRAESSGSAAAMSQTKRSVMRTGSRRCRSCVTRSPEHCQDILVKLEPDIVDGIDRRVAHELAFALIDEPDARLEAPDIAGIARNRRLDLAQRLG